MQHFFSRARLLSAALLVGHLSPAQRSAIGFKAGPIFSTFSSSSHRYQPIGGLSAGVWSNRWMTDYWSFQPELLFCQQGANRLVDNYTVAPVRLN